MPVQHASVSGSSASRSRARLTVVAAAAATAVVAALVVAPGAQAADTTVAMLSAPSGTVQADYAAFSFHAPTADYYECSLDSAAYSYCGVGTTTANSLSDGVHTLDVRAVVAGVPGSPTTATWTVDKAPATTIVSGPADGSQQTSSSVAFSFTASADFFECSLDAQPFSYCFGGGAGSWATTGLADGTHSFSVRAIKGATTGPATTRGFTVAADLDVAITAGPAQGSTSTSPYAAFAFGAPDAEYYECSLDGAGFFYCAGSSGGTTTIGTLAQGGHSFAVRARRGGDTGPATTRTWTVDTGLAVTVDGGPADGATISGGAVAFTFSASLVDFYECSVDSQPFSYCASPSAGYYVTTLPTGDHTFAVRASRQGATGPAATRAFTVADPSGTGLDVTITGPSGAWDRGWAAWSFSTPEAAYYECIYDAAPDWSPCYGTYTTNAAPPGTHTLDVRAVAADGSRGTTSTTTVQIAQPAAPSVSAPATPTPVTWSAWTFRGAHDTSSFECRFDSSADDTWSPCYGTYTRSALAPGAHRLDVRAVAYSGARSAASSSTVTVSPPSAPDLAGPTGAFPSSVGAWYFRSPYASFYQCRFDSAADDTWQYCYGTLSRSGMADGQHTLDVRSVDATGATSAITTSSIDVNAGPVAAFFVAPPATTGVDQAAWAFFAAGASYYECRYDSSAAADWSPCYGTVARQPLGDGTHTLEVRAVDGAGNRGAAVRSTVHVAASAPDTSITSAPASPSPTANATVEFASTEAGTFECRLDSVLATDWVACTSPRQLSSLADGAHTFDVRAIDVDGNVDQTPASASWSVDSTPPVLQWTLTPTDPTADTSSTFVWSSSDFVASAECDVDLAGWAPCTTTFSLQLTGLTTGSHTVSVRATDQFGRTGPPITYGWTIHAPPADQAPVAGGTTVTVAADSVDNPLSLAALAYDPDGDPLAFAVVTAPGHGTLTCGTDGACTYTPDAGYSGSDGFDYSASARGLTSQAHVQITVEPAVAPVVEVRAGGAQVAEGDAGTVPLNLSVDLSDVLAGDVVVSYSTSDGTAQAGTDYVGATGQIVIPAGQTHADIPVIVNGDTDAESDETFTLTIASTTPGVVVADPSALGLILDDDTPTPPACTPVSATLETPGGSATDGGASFVVDGLGAAATNADRVNPVGAQPAASTIYSSNVYLSTVDALLDDCFDGTPVTVVSQDSASLVTSRSFGSLTLTLTQRVESAGGTTRLVQSYEWSNTGGSAAALTLVRHLDGDLEFDGSIVDGGAAADGGARLYEYDQSDNPNAPSTYVGIQGSLGGSAVPDRWTIQSYDYRSQIVGAHGIPAADAGLVHNDANGDHIVDTGYDVTLSQQWATSLAAGQSITFVTETRYGTQSANRAPEPLPDSASTTEDATGVHVDVLTNDSDPDGQTLGSVVVTSQPAHGTVVCTASGSCDYTPAGDFNGTDQFVYQVADSVGATANATVTVTVTPVNDAPVAPDSTVSTAMDAAVDVTPAVTDVETATAQLVLGVVSVTDGTATVSGGTLTFTPSAGFTGSATLVYGVTDDGDTSGCAGPAGPTCDPTVLTAQGTVTIEVGAVDQPPTARDDSAEVQPGRSVVVPVLDNDDDPDNDPLSVTTPAPTSSQGKGTVSCDTSSCTYTASSGSTGTDTFQYSISDGRGGTATATVTITIRSCPDVVPALDASFVTGYSWVECSAYDAHAVSSVGPPVLSPSGGTVALLTTGDAALAASPNSDDGSGRDNGTFVRGAHDVSILRVDLDVPAGARCLAFDFAFESEEYPEFVNSSFNDGFLAELDVNDWSVASSTITAPHNFATGPGGEIVSVNSVFFGAGNVTTVTGTTYDGSTPKLVAQTPVTPGSHALYLSIFDAGDGILDSAALLDALRTTTSDCTAGVANRPPTAAGETSSLLEDSGAHPIDITVGDSDPDGDPLTWELVTAPAHGSVTITPGGSATYTPGTDYNGADSFTYRVLDGRGGSATATVALVVVPVNDAPSAPDVSASTVTGVAATVDVSTAASDLETPATALEVSTGTFAGGTASVTGTSVSITPATGFVGDLLVPYTVRDRGDVDSCGTVASDTCDPTRLTGSGTITVHVDGNRAPTAADGTLTVDEDSTAAALANSIDLAGLASDPDGNPLTYAVTAAPTHGSVSCTAGICTYAPAHDYNGPDAFGWSVSDGQLSTSAVVRITVRPFNDAPTAAAAYAVTSTGQQVTIPMAASISDLETADADLSLAVLNSSNGTASVSGTSIVFVPAAGFAGTAVVAYSVTDRGDPDACTSAVRDLCDPTRSTVQNVIEIAVQGPPVAVPDALTVDEDSVRTTAANAVDVSANDSDPNGDPLTFALQSAPTHGVVDSVTPGVFRYQPDPDYRGSDTFTYRVSDGRGGSAIATVSITVRPINDAPTANGLSATTQRDQAVTVDVGPALADKETSVVNLAVGSPTATTGNASFLGKQLTYTPPAGFVGTATVTYTVTDRGDPDACTSAVRDLCDPTVRSTTGTITITVQAPAALTITQRLFSGNSQVTTTGLGDNLVLRLTVTNTSAAPASGATVTATIPASVNLGATDIETVPAGCTWSSATRRLTCPAGAGGAVPAGGTAVLNIPVEVAFGCTIVGDSSNDTLVGTSGADVICGSGGSDTINGNGGDDTIYGYGPRSGGVGNPAPVVFPAASVKWSTGGPVASGTASVTIQGNDSGDAALDGGAGADAVYGEEGGDIMTGGGGADTLVGGAGGDTIDGNAGGDTIHGNDGADILAGGPGNDSLDGGAGNDVAYGGDGDDTIDGGDNRDDLNGGDGNDTIDGGAGPDAIAGNLGDDDLSGGDGADTIGGGPAEAGCVRPSGFVPCDRDIITGGAGNDSVNGGADHDYISGNGGDDVLEGGYGRDYVIGGTGNDDVNGGPAHGSRTQAPLDHWNWLLGGDGNDRCSFGPGFNANNTDYRATDCERPSGGSGIPAGATPRLDRVARP